MTLSAGRRSRLCSLWFWPARYAQQFIADVDAGERTFLSPVIGPVERGFYRLAGVDPAREQNWFAYTIAMVVFSVAGFLSLYVLQRLQSFLPLNPRGFDAVAPDLAFNTSVSFITNTNWQNYSGETTMSHLTQMLGLTVHNFLSAATGLAMAFALVRSFARSSATTVGNFWVDVTRSRFISSCRSRSSGRWSSSLSACRRRWSGPSTPRLWKAPSRPYRSGRSRARRSSRSSAPTAAAFSTPTRRIRSRTRTAGPTFSRSGRSC